MGRPDCLSMIKRTTMRKLILPIVLFAAIVALAACHDDDNVVVNDEIRNFIEQKYAGARILGAEREFNGDVDVDISHDGIHKDVYFDRNNVWIYTSWDVYPSQLPDVVKAAVQSEYPGYVIDDADYIQRESGDYYRLEIEKGVIEKTVLVSPEGEL